MMMRSLHVGFGAVAMGWMLTGTSSHGSLGPASHLHDRWDRLLKKHITTEGKVSYRGFLSDTAELNRYLYQLRVSPPNASWTRAEQTAFWINAYNAFTISLILRHYPCSSIRDLHGGKPWDVPFVVIGTERYTLNQIEHDVLRKTLFDPRLHFALNCAAASCPPLRQEAYSAHRLDVQLDDAARYFINNHRFNQITPHHARLSMIFLWYEKDFPSGIRAYVNRYAHIRLLPDATLEFLPYDWSLNDENMR